MIDSKTFTLKVNETENQKASQSEINKYLYNKQDSGGGGGTVDDKVIVDSSTTNIRVTPQHHVEQTYVAEGIKSVLINCPSSGSIKDGFIGGINIKTTSEAPTFRLVNSTDYKMHFIINGTPSSPPPELSSYTLVKLYIMYDGAALIITEFDIPY